MQNIIAFYYHIIVENFEEKNNSFYFLYNNEKYEFTCFIYDKQDLTTIVDMLEFLESRGIKTYTIIENVNKDLVTNFNNKNYILMKIINDNNIDFFDILEFNNKTIFNLSNYVNNWKTLWMNKVDKVEEILKNGNYDQIVNKTVDYYLGLAENAIQYLDNIQDKYLSSEARLCISHKRIISNNNFLNPLNMIPDIIVRDSAEYIKYLFFNNKDPLIDIKYLLNSNKFNEYEINLLFSRLLFPTYYFDILDNYFNKKCDSSELFNIVKKKDEYEILLKKAYYEFSQYAQLENVEWIKL